MGLRLEAAWTRGVGGVMSYLGFGEPQPCFCSEAFAFEFTEARGTGEPRAVGLGFVEVIALAGVPRQCL
jgi:hypothetical protein